MDYISIKNSIFAVKSKKNSINTKTNNIFIL